MNSIEVQTLIKGIYLIITPAAYDSKTLEIAQNVLTNHLDGNVTEKDILIARDEMTNQKMIENIKNLSLEASKIFQNILNDLVCKLDNIKSKEYCRELEILLINKKVSIFKTPNLNEIINIEKKMGW